MEFTAALIWFTPIQVVLAITKIRSGIVKINDITIIMVILFPATFPKINKDDKIELKEVFERANKYHFIHSLAMLGVPLCRWPRTVSTCTLT